MFPAMIAPALGSVAAFAAREFQNQMLKYAPEIIDDVLMRGRNSLRRMLGGYKTKMTLKKNNIPTRTLKQPMRRPRRRFG